MNQQRLNQPHIQSKIRKSGGMGTIKEATTRTRVNDMLEAKGGTIELQLQDMIERPSLYAHLDDSRHTLLGLALLEADRKGIVGPKNSHRPKLDKLRELERAAGVAIGRMKIEIANTLPVGIERIRFMTIGKVKVTLGGELI